MTGRKQRMARKFRRDHPAIRGDIMTRQEWLFESANSIAEGVLELQDEAAPNVPWDWEMGILFADLAAWSRAAGRR